MKKKKSINTIDKVNTTIKASRERESNLNNTDSLNNTDLQLQQAISDRGQHLEKLVEAILPATEARTRALLTDAIELTCDGCFYLDIMGLTGLTTPQLNGFKSVSKVFRELWHLAEDAGEDYRKAQREQLAHNHAISGTLKPVYQKGREVGTIREFDHRLLEFLLKADNPAKYRDQASSVNIQNNVQQIIVEKHRSMPEPPESETKAHTINIDSDKP